VHHREVEAAAVPGHELGRVFLDAFEKALDQLAFALAADRPHLEAVAVPQRAGNDDDPVQMERQEIAAGRLPPQLERHLRDTLVGDRPVEPVEAAQALDIGNGLDVEGENRRHGNGQDAPKIKNEWTGFTRFTGLTSNNNQKEIGS
jgi:hypothetical protein